MPLELAAVAFDGAFTAERELNNLRVSRLDPWVGEVAVLEHYHGSVHATRATSPDYGGTGYAGLPAGGLVGGPLGGPLLPPHAAGAPRPGGFIGKDGRGEKVEQLRRAATGRWRGCVPP